MNITLCDVDERSLLRALRLYQIHAELHAGLVHQHKEEINCYMREVDKIDDIIKKVVKEIG